MTPTSPRAGAGRSEGVAALLYLCSPALLFLGAFVKPVLGLPLGVALVALLAHAARRGWALSAVPLPPRGPKFVVALLMALGVVALMGFATGEYCWDWIKHWALLNSLEQLPWPVRVELQGQPGYLRFYIGAYLVPAVLASLTGLSIVACTALWYGAGLVLAFMLLGSGGTRDGSRWRLLWAVPLLLAMAGGDAWLDVLLRADSRPITFSGFHHEWWANALVDHPLQYGSMLCLLLWVPHQAIPTFIVVGLLRRLRTADALGPTALATSMLALWSPYALIGAVVLFLAHVCGQPVLRQALRHPGIARGGAAVVATAFAGLMAWTLAHELPGGGLCVSCAADRLTRPGAYVLFIAVELAIPLLVLRRRLFDDPTSIAALLTLIVLPWIGGPVPDPVMRISMPALIYLFARCAHEIAAMPLPRMAGATLLVLLLAGPTTWGEIGFHVEGGARHRALPARDPMAAPYYTVWATRTTYTAQEFFEICGWMWRPQYFTTTPPPTWPVSASAPAR
ncbi:hypothetical protein [Pelomonas cellulosilytica]|uniref:Uncharacterized protein n=1 Tax=Pelomonas cellulosilytica TaxID=2906762 RepID=A0ABS8XUF7_9BURK|nr:hypothetical protein [Pelomonas sp. P8]MCE4555518.1 hypothetical protein [Pelomonas sp. P8]